MTIENQASPQTPAPQGPFGSVESFDDGTPVRFVLSEPSTVPSPSTESRRRYADRPDGMGTAVPVARGGQLVADLAVETLRQSLRPVKPLLEEVHQAVSSVAVPPSEVSVTFGIQVGSDLKLGIVGSKGQAHLTVTASWLPADAAPADGSRGADGGSDEDEEEEEEGTATG
ncbi:CU044_2847 family protein [Streptomyces sp. NBC_00237]|uniref:CU044_2847 family protein n=1 Tax=Streptomyces sp. NBC_00237 TaxID=2975687 RepID=UPI0022594C4A|nr:CU044_2847 family protein [Streptomyces sp. NBC_00237]MCX5203674.1 CU044_2847 family protein [Streptomyces sp. NBC_00237]